MGTIFSTPKINLPENSEYRGQNIGAKLQDVLYLHLGVANLAGTTSGLATGFGTFTVSSGASGQSQEHVIKFEQSDTNQVPTGGSYSETTGDIVLPEGRWLICASTSIQNNVTGATGANVVWAALEIVEGDDVRHASSTYSRWAAVN